MGATLHKRGRVPFSIQASHRAVTKEHRGHLPFQTTPIRRTIFSSHFEYCGERMIGRLDLFRAVLSHQIEQLTELHRLGQTRDAERFGLGGYRANADDRN